MVSLRFSHLFSLRSSFSYAALLAALNLSTPAIAAASENQFSIQQVTPSKVTHCELIGDVKGSSGWGRIAIRAWAGKAKHQALQQAKNLGATHVVWSRFHNGYGSGPYAYGEAYNCSKAEALHGL
ncbi:conserved hypothetical protein [Nitrosococcus halophilus Nc 4]|uniref:Uncharacterized protein n=1 Tax=Nitrosococcus halophilus (strain Nc4) TaxID=472759 RepID=D5C4Q5_NITHN|nr:hypothetical protein [Nitrosococcus halophilus]ADE13328.1 conserved hypothetical protein [Nitrosococcus halophilus Nc 4]